MSERDNLVTALMTRYDLDEAAANSVIDYAKSLSVPDRQPNDYAIAKALNERTVSILDMIADAYQHNGRTADELDAEQLNRSYVLLVNELKQLYARNSQLKDIQPSPPWEYFTIIEGQEWEINQYEYHDGNDAGQQHNAQVKRLCILTGKDTPNYPEPLQKIVSDADKAISAYSKRLGERRIKSDVHSRDWYISEYRLAYKPDGTIVINDVLRLKKTQAGAASDKLMSQAVKQPNTLFKPDLGQYSRNLSTTLNGIGFSGVLRSLFFPSVSNTRGIVCRTVVSHEIAESEHLDTAALDSQLKELGAKVTNKGIRLDDIPF